MDIKHRVWRLRTYKFYPKANYFRKRILSVWPRFNNIINSFPPRFHVTWEKDAIDEEAVAFNRVLEVTATSNASLSLSKFIISEGHEYTTELIERPIGPGGENKGFCIYLIYISIQDLTRGNEIIGTVIEAFKNSIVLGPTNQAYIDHTFVYCEIDPNVDKTTASAFRDYINSYMLINVSPDWLGEENIVIGPDPIMLGSKISNHLEDAILDTFDFMYAYLDRFVFRGQCFSTDINDIAHVEDVERAILDYLRLGISSSDLIKQIQDEADIANEDQVVEIVIDDMNKKIKCVIGNPLSKKLAMKPVIVCLCLDEINFGKIIKDSISRVTKMHLIRMVKAVQQSSKTNTENRKNDFLKFGLLNDLSLAFRTIEKDLKKAAQTIDVMGKLQFEIEGCFKVAGQKRSIKDSTPTLPESLKKDLKQLDGIVGFGNIYGKLEIHVGQDVSQTIIEEVLRQHKFSSNFSVKTVTTEATPFARIQYEQGSDILSPRPGEVENGHRLKYRRGTIGIFAEARSDQQSTPTVYALTAAHVVNPCSKQEHEVYVIGRSLIKKKLGVSTPLMTINTGEHSDARLVDFAAVKVDPDMQEDCIRYVKDEEGMPKIPRIKDTHVAEFEKLPVYKFGAESNLTYGIVASVEYINRANSEYGAKYLVVIDKLPGKERPFAENGDSGSVVCTPCSESERHIELMAMISGGALKLEGDPSEYCFCFQIKKGLEALERKSGIQLKFGKQGGSTNS